MALSWAPWKPGDHRILISSVSRHVRGLIGEVLPIVFFINKVARALTVQDL